MSTLPRTAQSGDPEGSEPDPLGVAGDRRTPARSAAGELSLIFGDDFPDRLHRAAEDPESRAQETSAPATVPSRNVRLARLESAVDSLADRIEAVERLLRVVIERLDDVQAEARAAAESSHRVMQSLRDLPDRPFG
jgi:hypothetical protein